MWKILHTKCPQSYADELKNILFSLAKFSNLAGNNLILNLAYRLLETTASFGRCSHRQKLMVRPTSLNANSRTRYSLLLRYPTDLTRESSFSPSFGAYCVAMNINANN